jgi:hypothetical protein
MNTPQNTGAADPRMTAPVIGWTEGDGSGHDGYNVADYFRDGRYLGPDEHGIEPIFGTVAADSAQNFMLLCLDGEEPGNCGSHELHVGRRGNRLVNLADDFRPALKIIRETTVRGWGERLNGPAYVVDCGSLVPIVVPVREWGRVMGGAS